jgi:hypothetical protein
MHLDLSHLELFTHEAPHLRSLSLDFAGPDWRRGFIVLHTIEVLKLNYQFVRFELFPSLFDMTPHLQELFLEYIPDHDDEAPSFLSESLSSLPSSISSLPIVKIRQLTSLTILGGLQWCATLLRLPRCPTLRHLKLDLWSGKILGFVLEESERLRDALVCF